VRKVSPIPLQGTLTLAGILISRREMRIPAKARSSCGGVLGGTSYKKFLPDSSSLEHESVSCVQFRWPWFLGWSGYKASLSQSQPYSVHVRSFPIYSSATWTFVKDRDCRANLCGNSISNPVLGEFAYRNIAQQTPAQKEGRVWNDPSRFKNLSTLFSWVAALDYDRSRISCSLVRCDEIPILRGLPARIFGVKPQNSQPLREAAQHSVYIESLSSLSRSNILTVWHRCVSRHGGIISYRGMGDNMPH
jgi:hypothetical protein